MAEPETFSAPPADRAPRVSVVMAVRNSARHLAEAVESILAQTYEDFEFLIVDDASDDETPEILNGFASRDGRIRIIRNDANIGPYPSANRALATARGDYIARIDADDRCAPDRLTRQVTFLEERPDHLLVGCGYRSIDANGSVRFRKPNPMDDFAVRWTACFRMPMVHPGFCFRARLPDGTPVRYREDGFAAQDYALVGDLLGAGKAACIGDTLVDYRMHDGNISSTRLAEQNRTAEAVATRVLIATTDDQTARSFAPFLSVVYGGQSQGPDALALSVKAFRNLINGTPTARQRSWLRRRAAGYLADAFLRPARGFGDRVRFFRNISGLRLPLVLRALEVKGVLKPDPAPGEDSA